MQTYDVFEVVLNSNLSSLKSINTSEFYSTKVNLKSTSVNHTAKLVKYLSIVAIRVLRLDSYLKQQFLSIGKFSSI